ncbi:MAG: hypothetical protein V1863_05405 [Candidatus Omnitrophota bacterium]
MKKIMLGLLFAVAVLSCVSCASAEYAISVTYSQNSNHVRVVRPRSTPRMLHHPRNRGHFQFGYYLWPRSVIQSTRTVIVRQAQPVEKMLANQERLGISDVIVLSKAGLSDDTLIEKIVKTGSVFDLTVEEVEALRRERVSVRVVNFMLQTKKR